MPENTELVMLQRKFDTHCEEFERHREEFQRRREEEERRWEHLLQITENNAQANKETAEAVQNLTEATRGLLDTWQALDGAVRVGAAVGNFLKWLSGFAVLGAVVAWFVTTFGPPPPNG